jgi:hypothetical protein
MDAPRRAAMKTTVPSRTQQSLLAERIWLRQIRLRQIRLCGYIIVYMYKLNIFAARRLRPHVTNTVPGTE